MLPYRMRLLLARGSHEEGEEDSRTRRMGGSKGLFVSRNEKSYNDLRPADTGWQFEQSGA